MFATSVLSRLWLIVCLQSVCVPGGTHPLAANKRCNICLQSVSRGAPPTPSPPAPAGMPTAAWSPAGSSAHLPRPSAPLPPRGRVQRLPSYGKNRAWRSRRCRGMKPPRGMRGRSPATRALRGLGLFRAWGLGSWSCVATATVGDARQHANTATVVVHHGMRRGGCADGRRRGAEGIRIPQKYIHSC